MRIEWVAIEGEHKEEGEAHTHSHCDAARTRGAAPRWCLLQPGRGLIDRQSQGAALDGFGVGEGELGHPEVLRVAFPLNEELVGGGLVYRQELGEDGSARRRK